MSGTSPRCRAICSVRSSSREAERHLAQHQFAAPGRDRHGPAPIGRRQTNTPGGSRRVAGDVGLQPSQQRVRFGCERKEFVGGPGGGAARRSSRTSRPSVSSSVAGRPRRLVSCRRGGRPSAPWSRPAPATTRRWGAAATGTRVSEWTAARQRLHVGGARPGGIMAEQRKPSRQVRRGRRAAGRWCCIGGHGDRLTVVTRARHSGGCQARSRRAARRGRHRPAKR